LQDKIFHPEIIAALGRALGNENSDVRQSAVKIFIAAIAQGALSSVCGFFILKYLQMAFRTRYLTQNLLLHLDVHWLTKIPT